MSNKNGVNRRKNEFFLYFHTSLIVSSQMLKSPIAPEGTRIYRAACIFGVLPTCHSSHRHQTPSFLLIPLKVCCERGGIILPPSLRVPTRRAALLRTGGRISRAAFHYNVILFLYTYDSVVTAGKIHVFIFS
jgi:hypothetical protein